MIRLFTTYFKLREEIEEILVFSVVVIFNMSGQSRVDPEVKYFRE